MKALTSLFPIVTALSLALPVAGLSSTEARHWGGRHPMPCGGCHGSHFSPPCHGRAFYGGPLFWGPGIGFSYYNSPAYYALHNDAGYQRNAAAVSDDLGEDVQRALAERGFYHGAVDGEIGPESRAAIRAYQNKHGLEPTGRIDVTLLRSLRIE